MRTRFTRMFLGILIVTHTGCAHRTVLTSQPTAQQLYMAGRYPELRAYAEGKIARGISLEPAELAYLCGAYWKLQQYDKLLVCTDQMEQHVQQGRVPRRGMFEWDAVYSFMWGTAFGYLELGEYDRAIAQAQHAYAFGLEHQLDPFHQVYSLGALALAYALRGDRINALKYAKLLDEVDTSDYKYQSLAFEKWVNLAKIYMALGEYEQALAVMQRPDPTSSAHRIVQGLFLGKDALTYQKLPRAFMLAKGLFETGHRQEAKERYDAILQDPDAPANRDIYWLVLFDRGRIAEQMGMLDEAIRFYEQAVRVIEDTRATFKTESTKIGFVGSRQVVYHHLVAALFAAARYGQAFEYVERAKSRALVDLLASKKEFAIRQGDEQGIHAMLKQLETLEAQGAVQETGQGDVQYQTRSRGVQVARLRTQAPHLASLVTVAAVSLPDLQARLSSDEALVEYFSAGETLYAFVLTRQGVQAVQLSGIQLHERVEEFRNALEDPRSDRYRSVAQQLYAQLIAPLEGLLTAPNLILVPHGVLHYLPFGALYDGKQYLLDRCHLRYLPSASVMEYLDTTGLRPATTAMVMANPELGDHPPLRHAEQEARAVAQAFLEPTVLLRSEATETAFKRLGGHFSHLHLATHGVFAAENPLRSGLLLAKDADNDGLLSVEELYSLRLDADLVTLSACETGLGRISNGDDLVGLDRGFLYAGSRAIVASLWSVDDEATSYLMSEFYANLPKTNARDALRQAQLETRKRYPHPFYWAAFRLTGQR